MSICGSFFNDFLKVRKNLVARSKENFFYKAMKNLIMLFLLLVSSPMALAENFEDLKKIDQALYLEHKEGLLEAVSKQEYINALIEGNDALYLFKGDVSIYDAMIGVYLNLTLYEKALEMSEKVNDLRPESFNVLYNLGEIYFVNEKYEEALAVFNKAQAMSIEVNYYNERVISNLIRFKKLVVFELLDREDDYEAQLASIKPDEDNPLPLMSESFQYMRNSEFTKAAEIMAKARRIYGNEISLYKDTLDEAGYDKISLIHKISENLKFLNK